MMRMVKGNYERVVAVIPETLVESGIKKPVLRLCTTDGKGILRLHLIHEDEFSDELRALFVPAEAMYRTLSQAVQDCVGVGIEEGVRVVAVVPETCSAPGWENRIMWVYADKGGTLNVVGLQWDEMSPKLRALFGASEAMHRSLINAVKRYASSLNGGVSR